ncbi:hypothetical protein C0989_011408 [Termitomyces sp. Mn162]|nr:hypothetical protein C0989_011408 [Termitomyces sp. Mn162]
MSLPTRTVEETDAILCAPGHLHEVETIYLNGRMQRVYKHLWSSVREFWLSRVEKYSQKTYIVFEDQRYTYGEVHQRAVRVAAVFRHVYDVEKVVMLDTERAERLTPIALDRLRDRPSKFLVFDEKMDINLWPGMSSFPATINGYKGGTADILAMDPQILPEDNALVMFTSGMGMSCFLQDANERANISGWTGTTGLPKGVLSTQRQFLTNIPNVMVGGIRANLRKGGDYPNFDVEDIPQKGVLIGVPLFHVTGLTSFTMYSTMMGLKIVLTPKWIVEEAATLIKRENVRVAGGVPAMVSDLIDSSLAGFSLEGIFFGGSPAPDALAPRAKHAFSTATISLGSSASNAYLPESKHLFPKQFAGDDYTARPTSTGRASPVNEIKIVCDGSTVGPGIPGEVWLRGPNIMQCYWRDSDATENALTSDGWLRTGDLGYLDEEGFLYIKDRLKDIIIRGGENIDSVAVENALYRDPRISEAAAVGVPDNRLGELVAAVVSVKPAHRGMVTGTQLIATARK